MATIERDQLTIYYETEGDPAAPPLLLISGITDYVRKCDWQRAELARDYFVIAFDNRGGGQSSTPLPGYTTADMAGDAVAVLDALGIVAANPQSPAGYTGQLQAVMGHDVAERLGDIAAPALVMHGADDRLIPPDNGRLLAEYIPGARFILYPDAGHLFFIERANEVNRDIRAFLNDDKPLS